MRLRVVGLLILVLGASISGAPREATQARRIEVEAERFAFSPSRIKLTLGEEVEIVLRSADTSHGFMIEDSDVAVEIPKRGKGEVTVRYKASQVGRFKYECHRMCGAGHHFMRGEIIVVEPKDRP